MDRQTAIKTLRRLGRAVSRVAETRAFRVLSPPAALAIAFFLVRGQLRQLEGVRIMAALAATPAPAIALAAACTAANFACLAVVEVAALRFIGRPQPAARTAIASFAANAIQSAVGFGAITGAAVRLRAYAFAKLQAADVGRLVLTLSAANMLSGLIAEGVGLAASLPRRLAHHPAQAWIAVPALLLILIPAGAWFRLRRGGENGGLGARGRAVALAAALGDWIFSAGTLFFLSAKHVDAFFRFLAVFSLGSLAASVTGAPAGIGVLDAAVLGLGSNPIHETAAALIAFRIVYYFAPLALVLAGIAAQTAAGVVRRAFGRRV